MKNILEYFRQIYPAFSLVCLLIPEFPLESTVTYTVDRNTDSITDGSGTTGSLRYCMSRLVQGLDPDSSNNYVINMNSSLGGITLSNHLPVVGTFAGSNPTITINGNSNSIAGGNAYQAFFATSLTNQGADTLTVNISGLTLSNCSAIGGLSGGGFPGGGALGAGAGVFVDENVNASITNMAFSGCNATGGNAGDTTGNGGGGGGYLGVTATNPGVFVGGSGGGGFRSGGGLYVGGGGGGNLIPGFDSSASVGGDGVTSGSTSGGGGGGLGIGGSDAPSTATGGSGGNGFSGSGGGAGAITEGQAGGSGSNGGGGGGGALSTTSANGGAGGSGSFGAGGGGGAGNSDTGNAGDGGSAGKFGGGGGSGNVTGMGPNSTSGRGGDGGDFGGGGGNGVSAVDSSLIGGGNGGFGGGGGGCGYGIPGNGGFGGGGGAGFLLAGLGGVEGGDAIAQVPSGIPAGGGGAGLGGAVFVRANGSLSINAGCTFSGNTVAVGTGGNNGNAKGGDIYLMGPITTTGDVTLTGSIGLPPQSSNLVSTFIKNGNGTLTLSAASDFDLPTFIQSGTLSISNDNQLGTNTTASVTIGTATLQMGNLSLNSGRQIILSSGSVISVLASDTATVPGIVSGGAPLTKAGPGTLVLSSASNSYTGATVINQGTLSLSGSGVLPSGSDVSFSGNSSLDISAITPASISIGSITGTSASSQVVLGGKNLVLSSNGNTSFAGIISGVGGSLTKQGSGVFTLTGSNTYTGTTLVTAGTLVVNGSLAGPVTVNSGSTLKGTGILSDTLTLNGTLSPGNSIGTIHLNSVNFNNGSVLQIEIDPSVSSSASVTSTAGFSGNVTLLVTPDSGKYTAGTTYEVLSASSISNTGTISVQSQNAAFQFQLGITSTQLNLILLNNASTSISLTSLSGNNLKTAEYLNTLDASSDFQIILSELDELPTDQLNDALSSISPVRNAYGTFATQQVAFSFSDIVSQRSSQLKFAKKIKERAPKDPVAGLSEAEDFLMASLFDFEDLIVSSSETVFQVRDQIEKENENYDIWISGFGEFAYEHAQKQSPAFKMKTGGALVGFDVLSIENVVIGSSLGYARINVSESNGHQGIDDYVASLYSRLFFSGFYLDSAVWGGYMNVEKSRTISYPGFYAKAKSHNHQYQLTPHLGFGYDFTTAWGGIEPFAQFDWAINFESSLKESGAGAFDMKQSSRTSSMLRSEIGLGLFQVYSPRFGGIFVVREQLSYVNKAPFSTGRVQASIVGQGGSFSVETLTADQNLIAPAVELFYKGYEGIFGSASYQGEFGSGYRSNSIYVKIGKYF